MSVTRPVEILRQLESSDTTDADLLARFAVSREAAAFEELVRRHGALVLGVCRRVLRNQQDSEDAFQAVFLVLAQKAGSLRIAGLLGNWLYGVAYRVALRARRAKGRRLAREVTMSNPPEAAARDLRPLLTDLAPVLDEELAALPAHYRDAIILCDLQGATREEAATSLGVPAGTLSSRLANGRKRLAARLTKRGVALSVAALPAALAEVQAATTAHSALITQTARLACDVAAGGAVPRSLANLLKGGSAMRKTLLIGAMALVSVAGAVFAARPGAEPPTNEPPRPPAVAEKPVQPPAPKEQPKPLPEKAVAFTIKPKLTHATDLPLSSVRTVLWSEDGKRLAVRGAQPINGTAKGKTHRGVIALCETGEAKPLTAYLSDDEELVGFATDGQRFVTVLREYDLVSGRHELKVQNVEKAIGDTGGFGPAPGEILWRTKVLRTVPLDATETHSYAFAPDLKSYRTVATERNTAGDLSKLVALEVDAVTGKARELMTPARRGAHAISSNGKRIAVFGGRQVSVYDLDGKQDSITHTFEEVTDPKRPQPEGSQTALALSSNGKRLAVVRGISWTTILDTDTGKALPELEGIKELQCSLGRNSFSADGRLFAATCQVYVTKTSKSFRTGTEQTSIEATGRVLVVWDTQTGKALKSWKARGTLSVAFCPTKPLLAILERSSEAETRLGFWDFSAEVAKK